MVGELSMEGPNLFIDFSIITKSKLKPLTDEFDKVIRVGKLIYVWSKTTPVADMIDYCKKLKVARSPEEVELHKKCCSLRLEGKIYKEIATELKIPVENVSYYVTTDPNRDWALDDWIQDYLVKDSTNYQKVDMIIDNDPKVVARFVNQGLFAQYLEKIV